MSRSFIPCMRIVRPTLCIALGIAAVLALRALERTSTAADPADALAQARGNERAAVLADHDSDGEAAGDEGAPQATGCVYEDRNGNGVRDKDEPGIAGVRVSNQREVVATDEQGRWELPVTDDTTFFVVKPRGYRTQLSHDNLPLFYYHHRPAGSPASRFGGIAPTGPLPESIDFPLTPQEEPDRFTAVIMGDTQPRNETEVDYIAHDVIAEMIGKTDALMGVTLGDIVFDNLDCYESLIQVMGKVGIPWHNVIGNHDMNYDTNTDEESDETYRRVFGPSYYSYDYGPVHFVSLDDVYWSRNSDGKGRYVGRIGAMQLKWLEADLALTPIDQLVVLTMHIPLRTRSPSAGVNVMDRAQLFKVIESRPHCVSISAHMHFQEHYFYGPEDGFHGETPHHHVHAATACGCWWGGDKDELGIPHATMMDGAPNGYLTMTFDGNDYSMRYRATRRPRDYQMNIHAPGTVDAGTDETEWAYANVFNGSSRSTVQMRVNAGEWITMDMIHETDPFYAQLTNVPRAVPVGHLWRAPIPKAGLTSGVHTIAVRSVDMFDQTDVAHRLFRVAGN